MKTCTKCGKELSEDKFGFHKYTKDGLVPSCKICVREYNRLYDEKNRESIKAKKRLWQQSNSNAIKERKRLFQKKHKTELYERRKIYVENNYISVQEGRRRYYRNNREKMIKRVLMYARLNPEIFRVNAERRRSRKKGLPSTLTIAQWELIKRTFNDRCAYCGNELPLQQEHFIPLSKGGEYTHNNIIPSCKSCNSSKHDRNFFEWYPECQQYSKKRELFLLKFLNYKNNIQQLALM